MNPNAQKRRRGPRQGHDRGGRPERRPRSRTPIEPLHPTLTPPDIRSFAEWALDPSVLRAIADMGIEVPTPIQRLAIQPGLDGRDIIAKAETGTGKTLAFGAPLVSRIDPARVSVLALVLCPTRELAEQVANVLAALGAPRGIKVALIVGGEPAEPQVQALKAGAQIVVGTPGRVLDLYGQRFLSFPWTEAVVLDEADVMFEIGFVDDIKKILALLPDERQTLLFSATFPPELLELARSETKEPVEVATASGVKTVDTIDQCFMEVADEDRPTALVRLIEQSEPEDVFLVFCDRRTSVDRLMRRLERIPFSIKALHGGYDQSARFRVMSAFRTGEVKALVATDVASRGLDVAHVTHVVNYAPPQDITDYTHRIGRTGRAGRTGVAITFVTPETRRRWRSTLGAATWEIRQEALPERTPRGRTRRDEERERFEDGDEDARPARRARFADDDRRERGRASRDEERPRRPQAEPEGAPRAMGAEPGGFGSGLADERAPRAREGSRRAGADDAPRERGSARRAERTAAPDRGAGGREHEGPRAQHDRPRAERGRPRVEERPDRGREAGERAGARSAPREEGFGAFREDDERDEAPRRERSGREAPRAHEEGPRARSEQADESARADFGADDLEREPTDEPRKRRRGRRGGRGRSQERSFERDEPRTPPPRWEDDEPAREAAPSRERAGRRGPERAEPERERGHGRREPAAEERARRAPAGRESARGAGPWRERDEPARDEARPPRSAERERAAEPKHRDAPGAREGFGRGFAEEERASWPVREREPRRRERDEPGRMRDPELRDRDPELRDRDPELREHGPERRDREPASTRGRRAPLEREERRAPREEPSRHEPRGSSERRPPRAEGLGPRRGERERERGERGGGGSQRDERPRRGPREAREPRAPRGEERFEREDRAPAREPRPERGERPSPRPSEGSGFGAGL